MNQHNVLMPSKQSFTISKVTSYEEGFSPQNLEQHSPYSNGWHSGRYCNYPQQMIITFENRLRLRKIQILSHDYMISQRIDLFCSSDETSTDNSYKRLGYVNLSDNQHTGFQARELKSINIDITCHSLKILLQKNHINKFNLFNQVSIVAINIIGQPDVYDATSSTLESGTDNSIGNSSMIDQIIKGQLTRPYVSYMDDLLFAMYTDPEIVHFIQLLEERKLISVASEEFDLAGHLKQAVSDLREAGKRLAKLEVEKKESVEKEDYSRAKVKKQQSEEFRSNTYANINLAKLLTLSDVEFSRLRKSIVYVPKQEFNCLSSSLTVQQKMFQSKQTAITHGNDSKLYSMEQSVPMFNVLPHLIGHYPQLSDTDNITLDNDYSLQQQIPEPVAPEEDIKDTLTVSDICNPVTTLTESSIPVTPRIFNTSPATHKDHTLKAEYTPLPMISSTSPQLTTKVIEASSAEFYTNKPRVPDHSLIDYDNLVLPTLRQDGQLITEIDTNNNISIDLESKEQELDKLEKLSEKNAKSFASEIDIFGYTTVSQLLSKHFKHRENGLQSVLEYFKSYNLETSSHSPSAVLYSIIELLKRLFSDKIFPVFQLSVLLLTYLLNDFVTSQHVESGCVTALLDKCYRELVTRIGDSTSQRVRVKAMEASLEIVTYSSIKNSCAVLSSVLLSPLKPSTSAKLASGRLDLVKAIVEQHKPLSSLGLNPSHVATFGIKLLKHNHTSVRDSAISLLTLLHSLHANAVRSLLPQNNTLEAKNPTYKTLMDTLSKCTDVIENIEVSIV